MIDRRISCILNEKTMTPLIRFFLTFTFFLLTAQVFSQSPLIENRRWVLDKITNLETKRTQFIDEYHYLEFRGGRVRFAIDCNICSQPYAFVSVDTIHIEGPTMTTKKGCLERDVIRIKYDGKYKIWRQGMYLVIRTGKEDHFYK